jgi:hypothetical protein
VRARPGRAAVGGWGSWRLPKFFNPGIGWAVSSAQCEKAALGTRRRRGSKSGRGYRRAVPAKVDGGPAKLAPRSATEPRRPVRGCWRTKVEGGPVNASVKPFAGLAPKLATEPQPPPSREDAARGGLRAFERRRRRRLSGAELGRWPTARADPASGPEIGGIFGPGRTADHRRARGGFPVASESRGVERGGPLRGTAHRAAVRGVHAPRRRDLRPGSNRGSLSGV